MLLLISSSISRIDRIIYIIRFLFCLFHCVVIVVQADGNYKRLYKSNFALSALPRLTLSIAWF